MDLLQRCSSTAWQGQSCTRTQPGHCALAPCQSVRHGHQQQLSGHHLPPPSYRHRNRSRRQAQVVYAFQIDRRHHLELAWRRQQEREERLAQVRPTFKPKSSSCCSFGVHVIPGHRILYLGCAGWLCNHHLWGQSDQVRAAVHTVSLLEEAVAQSTVKSSSVSQGADVAPCRTSPLAQ